MNREDRLKRLRFRAWHRGTREADYMMGCFFDRFHAGWDEASLDWYEALLNQEDADILGWVMGSIPVPTEWRDPMMERMQRIDYVEIPQ
ncbi:succinate dehydrogenase assembly factor 2 [Sphingomonadaceae bacterium G21617-S1]|jgi:antitoxin CptB|uniref:FAD assembly factor SdhE n=1 Tax=Rhizorhabdus sp. TaxID=1968843 RepID=UPI00121C61A3|nr:succinate dehydrogenase assembly factor 2 [Rhizorhabdus sp.]MBD3760888.1 succinate dehydrogenase assembly factor 2 [Rhizorhabdus sp.]MCZ4342403.1 succinate dehydrogenase assembly factor 2 [Sphingomonadaceae bacterium G21617-S1]TAK10450.1 MAG: succinate dehydrogenase assembly factor 2 [Rhizorhabdus sp.]